MAERSRFDPIKPASYFRAGETLKAALEKHDPFWGPQLIVLAAIALDLSLPEKLTIGPTWLLPSLEGLLLLALLIASPHPRMRHSPLRRKLAMTVIAFVSLANVISLVLLIHYLLHHTASRGEGRPLILAGIVLWVTNVLLFGLWCWELDRGGPIDRALRPDAFPDFLFPQIATPRSSRLRGGCPSCLITSTSRSRTRPRSAPRIRCPSPREPSC